MNTAAQERTEALLVSVIVPVYNTAPWLRKCLDSIINQTYRNLEIICVNDGSTDDSASILDAYAAKDARIKVIHQGNAGVSVARNRGVDIAAGEYVTFVDSDDWLEPDAYEHLLPWMGKGADMVCFGVEGIKENGEVVREEYYNLPASGEQIPNSRLIDATNAYIWNKLFRLELIKQQKVTFPVGKRYEDAVFFYIAAALCRTICYVPEVKYCYLQRADSFTNGGSYQNRPADICEILEILYLEFKKRGLLDRWDDLYKRVFLRFYEDFVLTIPLSRQREAKKLYKAMVLRQGLHRRYKGCYPFHEISRYSFLRSLFFWRNAKTRLYKLPKFVILRVEETPEGIVRRWFWSGR